jgi:hypothetical protein
MSCGFSSVSHEIDIFEMDRQGKWNIERASVNVDTQDGHIVWSQTFVRNA